MKDKDGCWEIGGGNNLGGLCGPQLYWSWLNEVPEGHRDWMVQSWQCMLPARWMNSLINTQTCTSQESATSAYDGLKRHTAFDLMHCNQCKTLQQRQQGFVFSNLLIEWVWCRNIAKTIVLRHAILLPAHVSVLQNKTTLKKSLSYFDISCSTSAQSNKNNTRGTQIRRICDVETVGKLN